MQRQFEPGNLTAANLVFTSVEMPGYSRVRHGRGFSYRLPNGTTLKNGVERRRILSLAIPPAYQDVWICRNPNGHLQATGIDARGRKQYLYHPAWFAIAADQKFSVLPEFAASLPRIRAACRKALTESDLSRERVIAGIVMLLDRTGYRIGNSRYEKDNGSYGLSSLHNRHVRAGSDHIRLRFRGKSGMEHEARIVDSGVIKLILALQNLPGQHLFRYQGDDGKWRDIESSDVNGWIRQEGGGEHSAKEFRTWKATALCALELKNEAPPEDERAAKQVVNAAIKATAALLNHTQATCRKYYIHPNLLQAYRDGRVHQIMKAAAPRLRKADGTARLHATERRVYKIISSATERK